MGAAVTLLRRIWTRRKVNNVMSDDFDAILDRCLADIAAGRATIDSCMRRYPAHADRLAALVKIAERARTAPATPLPIDKRRVLEARLLKRASQLRSRPVTASTAAQRPVWRWNVVWVAASVMVALLLVGSAVTASAASVPGDALYPLKRTTEQVRLALAPAQQQADLHLEFARQRLQEVRTLTDRGEVSDELLSEISSETDQVLKQIPALPPDKQQMLLASLTSFQDQSVQVLQSIASSTQGDVQAEVMAALADAESKHQQAMDLLVGATSTTNPINAATDEPRPTDLFEETPPLLAGSAVPPTIGGATGEVTDVPPSVVAATAASAAPAQDPTPDVEHTPPGQVKQATPFIPPGQAKQATPHSPPPPKPTKPPKK
jgi:hypothetical protein